MLNTGPEDASNVGKDGKEARDPLGQEAMFRGRLQDNFELLKVE
jgi:hypothetical protein